jgi:hypothetical protein
MLKVAIWLRDAARGHDVSCVPHKRLADEVRDGHVHFHFGGFEDAD